MPSNFMNLGWITNNSLLLRATIGLRIILFEYFFFIYMYIYIYYE
uniref:Uncharacterized protein n=1 Tax=Heterorhabditis bacteriophora TaxID=37862 RepID=A0A1I7XTE3_HETBA